MSTVAETPIAHTDPVNAKILAVSEDRIQGFVRDPIGVIAAQSGVDEDTVIERVRAMLPEEYQENGETKKLQAEIYEAKTN